MFLVHSSLSFGLPLESVQNGPSRQFLPGYLPSPFISIADIDFCSFDFMIEFKMSILCVYSGVALFSAIVVESMGDQVAK